MGMKRIARTSNVVRTAVKPSSDFKPLWETSSTRKRGNNDGVNHRTPSSALNDSDNVSTSTRRFRGVGVEVEADCKGSLGRVFSSALCCRCSSRAHVVLFNMPVEASNAPSRAWTCKVCCEILSCITIHGSAVDEFDLIMMAKTAILLPPFEIPVHEKERHYYR